MKIHIRIFLTLQFLIAPLISSAQSRIVYRYDGSGNRVLRMAAPVSNNAKASPDADNPHAVPMKDTSVRSVTVTYSAAADLATVDIPQSLSAGTCRISVYNTDGALLFSSMTGKGTSTVPFSTFPKGVYVLNVECGKERHSVKITKN